MWKLVLSLEIYQEGFTLIILNGKEGKFFYIIFQEKNVYPIGHYLFIEYSL